MLPLCFAAFPLSHASLMQTTAILYIYPDADTKITSFQRQLNLYGFRRISKGPDQGAYFHSKFQRNRKDLLADIKRLAGKAGKLLNDTTDGKMVSIPDSVLGKHDASGNGYQEWPLQSFSGSGSTASQHMNPRMGYGNNYYNSIPRNSGVMSSSASGNYGGQGRSPNVGMEVYPVPVQGSISQQPHPSSLTSSEPRNKMSKLSMNIGFDKYMFEPRSGEKDPFEWCNELPRAYPGQAQASTSSSNVSAGAGTASGGRELYGDQYMQGQLQGVQGGAFRPGIEAGFEGAPSSPAMDPRQMVSFYKTNNIRSEDIQGQLAKGLEGSNLALENESCGFWAQNFYQQRALGGSGSRSNFFDKVESEFDIQAGPLGHNPARTGTRQEESEDALNAVSDDTKKAAGGGAQQTAWEGIYSESNGAVSDDFLLSGIDLSSEDQRNEFMSLMSFGDL